MNYPQEQISESGYLANVEYWNEYASVIGGIEVCDDETGELIYVIS